MKLEPIWLLGPPTKPAVVSRRRVLAGLASTAVAGVFAGWMARGVLEGGPPRDAELDWALALVHGRLDRLVEQESSYLILLAKRGEECLELWRGYERLAEAVLDGDPAIARTERERLGRDLIATSRSLAPPESVRLVLERLHAAGYR